MRTGQMVNELGLYCTECCDAELIFDFGDILPLCPRCLYGCEWEIEEELMTISELERLNSRAA